MSTQAERDRMKTEAEQDLVAKVLFALSEARKADKEWDSAEAAVRVAKGRARDTAYSLEYTFDQFRRLFGSEDDVLTHDQRQEIRRLTHGV